MGAALAVFLSLFAARTAGFCGYVLQDPFSLDGTSARLWLSFALWPILLAAALWAAAAGLGRLSARALGAAPKSPLDGIAAAALGLGLLGQAVFLLGWGGGLRPALLAALAAAAATAAALPAGAMLRLRPALPRFRPLEGAAAGLLAFAAACTLLSALAPPIEWDVRAYHLTLPEIALLRGRFARIPWMIHAHWPHLMEALYALPLAAGRDSAAALLHAGTAALLVAGSFLAAKKAAGPAAGWTAALLLAGQPALLREAGTAHADGACALFAFAAAWALQRWEEEGGEGRLAAAGMLAGLGAAAKMTGLAAVAGGMTLVLWRTHRPRAPLLFGAAAALMVGPWLLKTWIETGGPFWPFASGSDASASALAARYLRSNRWGFPPPYSLLTHDGPLFLLGPCAALALLVPSPRARAAPLERALWTGAPFFLVLTWRHNETWRFLMPLWPALALAAGRRAADAFASGRLRAAAAAALVAAGATPIALASPNNELFAVFAPRPASAPGADRRALFEDRSLDIAAFLREARSALPPGARVLLFREIRGYGAGFDYVWGDPMNQGLIDYRALPDPDALAARLAELGITHVLDHPASGLYREDSGYYDRRTLALMAECLRRRASPVLDRGGLLLHRLEPRSRQTR